MAQVLSERGGAAGGDSFFALLLDSLLSGVLRSCVWYEDFVEAGINQQDHADGL